MKKIAISISLFVVILFAACSSPDNTTGKFVTDSDSMVEWKGSTSETFNTGSFAVNSYDIVFENGRLRSGTFTMPVASIQNFNIENPDVRAQLINHLQSPDFFNMALNPVSKFVVTSVQPIGNAPQTAIDGANFNIMGSFTMCGVTRLISVPAKIKVENRKLSIESLFSIDRTKWGMNYAADPALGPHHILPNVELHLKVKATQQ